MLCELIGKRRVRIADDLFVAVIFHHDHKHVIKTGHALGNRAFVGEGGADERTGRKQSSGGLQIPFHSHDFSLSIFSEEFLDQGT